MQDNYLPTIDLSFIVDCLLACPKIDPNSNVTFGNVVMFALAGNKPIYKRMIVVTHDNGQVDYETASGLASRFRFLGAFLEWMKDNREWNEGAYYVKDKSAYSEEEAAEE